MRPGSESASTGTLAGLSTLSSRSHAVVVTRDAATTAAVKRRRSTARRSCLAMMNRIVRYSRSEGETEGGREAGGRRQDRLEPVRELAHRADFRIPDVLVGNVDVDHAVARRLPAILRRPEHRQVAAGDADRRARRTDAPNDRRLHRVRRGQLAE